MKTQITLLQTIGFALVLSAQEQDPHAHHHHHSHSEQQAEAQKPEDRATNYLLGLSSGTAVNPKSWAMPMVMQRTGDWNLMWMGQAFVVNTQQTGPRGRDAFYSANWGMLAATHKLGRGSVMLRGMVSLDPLTVRNRQYPLLFQSGETAYGKAIMDGQHPHDFIMELGIHYARPVGEKALVHVYYAPVGDAALGPVAFPHRASAMELPQAVLGHHYQDATHIASNVLTAGVTYGKVRFEASGFRGREPNENRWNIDMGRMDSWSGRVTWQPGQNWVAQVSAGRIESPETTHPGDVVRTTASLQYTKKGWSSTVVWGQNYKTANRYPVNSVLAETLVPLGRKNRISGRFEWSQRDELFEGDEHHIGHELFNKTGKRAFGVGSYTVGYTREIAAVSALHMAAGFNFTAYSLASELKPYYGSKPVAASVFVRFRLDSAE